MIKVFVYILIFLFIVVMSFAPSRNYMSSLFNRDMQELSEEEIIGRGTGHNPRIEEMQKALKETGFDPGPADGVMGSQTRAAIKGFQKEKRLKTTGQLDSVTQLTLNREKEIKKPSFKVGQEFDLQDITLFDRTEQIQIALKNAGFYNGTIDGKIGSRTKIAIREFQTIKGLNPDGVVGSKTWEVLKIHLKDE